MLNLRTVVKMMVSKPNSVTCTMSIKNEISNVGSFRSDISNQGNNVIYANV